MTRSVDIVDFFRSRPDDLLALMAGLATERDGWVNIQAVVDDDQEPPDGRPVRAGLFSLAAGRGPAVPVATWVPGEPTRKGPAQDSLGIQHGAGPKARFRLRDAGVEPPEGASLLSDHPKRGLVLGLAPGTDPAAVLGYLFAACDVLSADPLPDTWVAVIHHR